MIRVKQLQYKVNTFKKSNRARATEGVFFYSFLPTEEGQGLLSSGLYM